MGDKNAADASLVARYKAAAALRLAEQRAKNKGPPAQSGEARGVVVTVRFAHDAKPLSIFGGVTEVIP